MRVAIGLVLAMILVGCGGGQSPAPSSSAAPSPVQASPVASASASATASASASASASAIALRLAPADLGCDAMQAAYQGVTFRIDPTAAEQVTAVTNLGGRLLTYWAAGFRGGTAADPVVWDPAGNVVARDGEQLAIPVGAWPRLHGHFVCPSTDALYVLDKDPS
jgi:hypothetical protein